MPSSAPSVPEADLLEAAVWESRENLVGRVVTAGDGYLVAVVWPAFAGEGGVAT